MSESANPQDQTAGQTTPAEAAPPTPATATGWDEEYDVVIVGSGGGGMAAALTAADAGLSAVIVEKGSKYGGSTAISGGGIWVPNNPTLRRKGHNDSRESIQAYLKHLTKG